jgi:hypothetical protein
MSVTEVVCVSGRDGDAHEREHDILSAKHLPWQLAVRDLDAEPVAALCDGMR